MYGKYDRSLGQKILLTVLHGAAVCIAAWILFGSGLATVAGWFHRSYTPGPLWNRALLFLCALIYFARIAFASFAFVKRSVDWGEAAGIGLYAGVIHILFAYLGARNGDPLLGVTLAGFALYLAGSSTTTSAEFLRELWKQDLANIGKLYTRGLFGYARHINYLGEEVLFFGYAMITGSLWAFLVPAIMAASFVFLNIPALDGYLRKKYGYEFDAYSARTRKFIPFVY